MIFAGSAPAAPRILLSRTNAPLAQCDARQAVADLRQTCILARNANGDHTYAKTDRVRYSPASAHISYSQPYYTPRTVLV